MGAEHSVKRKNGEEVKTQLIVIISTYHFTRDNETTDSPTIHPSDCTVQFKYSSTEFRASTGEESTDNSGFFFDKHGLSLPYPAFVNLMKNSKFHLYIKRCAEFKARDEKALNERRRNAILEISPNDNEQEEDQQQQDETDPENELLGSKGNKRKAFKQPAAELVVEGAIKKPKFAIPNSPASPTPGTSRPTTAQIAARLTEAVRQINKKNL